MVSGSAMFLLVLIWRRMGPVFFFSGGGGEGVFCDCGGLVFDKKKKI